MSRAEGFAVMDVSTSICDDPKFRRLARENPELVAPAFTAYVAVMAESWKDGRRVSVEHAWPGFLPFDQTVCDALRRVALVDARGLVSTKAWRGWYLPAETRRSKSRDRWARYNANRDADTTLPPRGSDADTATSDPSVPSVRPSAPSGRSVPPVNRARGENDDGLKAEERRKKLQELSDKFNDGKLSQIDYERLRREIA